MIQSSLSSPAPADGLDPPIPAGALHGVIPRQTAGSHGRGAKTYRSPHEDPLKLT